VFCETPIDQSCFGEGGCFNFSLCNITTEGITIEGVTTAPFFYMGAPNSTLPVTFQVGNTGSPYHTVIFGRRFGVSPPAYQIALFQTFATNVLIESAQFMTLRSIFDMNIISETGAVNVISQAGSITFNSVTDMYFIQSSLVGLIKFTPARYFNISTTYIDFSVSSIGNSIPGKPVTFQDSDGVSFNNTFIFNAGEAAQPLDCNQTGALIVNDNMVVWGNLTVAGYIFGGNTTTLECPSYDLLSDERVKHDIQEVDLAHSYERITRKMPLHSFKYTQEYLDTPGRSPHIRNATYVGVIAQEARHDFDYMVSRKKGTLGTRDLHDMHSIHPELLYGEIVAAMQHMRKLHDRLVDRVEAMEVKASRMARAALGRGHELASEVADKGASIAKSTERQMHRVLSSLHARLERLEQSVTLS
jgi:hypothetical protein